MVTVRLSDIADALGAGPSHRWLLDPDTGRLVSARKATAEEAARMLQVSTTTEETEIMQAFLESLDENEVPAELSWGVEPGQDPEEAFHRAVDGSKVEDAWWEFRDKAYAALARTWCADHGIEYEERESAPADRNDGNMVGPLRFELRSRRPERRSIPG